MENTHVRYDGRALLVTGGGRGIGRAQALLLAARRPRRLAPSARTRMMEWLHDTPYSEWLFNDAARACRGGTAYPVSDSCAAPGEASSLGGGRIAHVREAKTEGVLGASAAIPVKPL